LLSEAKVVVMGTAAVARTRSDDSIREDVLNELKWDPITAFSDIAVEVADGVVRLSGFVSNYWKKDEAEKIAKRVYGVKGVTNDIAVQLTSPRSDSEIARDVIRALENHVAIPAEKIQGTVKDGWVTLEGTVDWPYQKMLAEAAVKQLRGVVGVTNNIEHRARY
jgi:osmotically-inducible protein OsmY